MLWVGGQVGACLSQGCGMSRRRIRYENGQSRGRFRYLWGRTEPASAMSDEEHPSETGGRMPSFALKMNASGPVRISSFRLAMP